MVATLCGDDFTDTGLHYTLLTTIARSRRARRSARCRRCWFRFNSMIPTIMVIVLATLHTLALLIICCYWTVAVLISYHTYMCLSLQYVVHCLTWWCAYHFYAFRLVW